MPLSTLNGTLIPHTYHSYLPPTLYTLAYLNLKQFIVKAAGRPGSLLIMPVLTSPKALFLITPTSYLKKMRQAYLPISRKWYNILIINIKHKE